MRASRNGISMAKLRRHDRLARTFNREYLTAIVLTLLWEAAILSAFRFQS